MESETPIEPGDYVYASYDGSLDPRQAWAVGWVKHIYRQAQEDGGAVVGYLIGDKQGKRCSTTIYAHARRVSFESAHRICRTLRPRISIGDQIRAFLREEAAERRRQQANPATHHTSRHPRRSQPPPSQKFPQTPGPALPGPPEEPLAEPPPPMTTTARAPAPPPP